MDIMKSYWRLNSVISVIVLLATLSFAGKCGAEVTSETVEAESSATVEPEPESEGPKEEPEPESEGPKELPEPEAEDPKEEPAPELNSTAEPQTVESIRSLCGNTSVGFEKKLFDYSWSLSGLKKYYAEYLQTFECPFEIKYEKFLMSVENMPGAWSLSLSKLHKKGQMNMTMKYITKEVRRYNFVASVDMKPNTFPKEMSTETILEDGLREYTMVWKNIGNIIRSYVSSSMNRPDLVEMIFHIQSYMEIEPISTGVC